jgi:hypothetical protein
MGSFSKFALLLFAILTIVFGIHVFILTQLGHPVFEHLIVEAYLLNYGLAIGIYLTLFLLKKKMSTQMGFLYMAGSFLKFLFFFIFFYPSYKLDGSLDAYEFAAFFTPYVISLFFETLGVIDFLKK